MAKLTDEWDGEPAAPVKNVHPTAEKARLLVAIEAQIEEFEVQAKGLRYELAREFPASPGTHSKKFDDVTVTLDRSERWTWDKDTLKDILDGEPPGPLKDEIARRYIYSITIHKRDFKKLSAEAQKALRRALTVKDGPFTIKVEDDLP